MCSGSLDQYFMMDTLSYFSFKPVLNDWYNRAWYVLSYLWDSAYKRYLAANQKVAHVVATSGFFFL